MLLLVLFTSSSRFSPQCLSTHSHTQRNMVAPSNTKECIMSKCYILLLIIIVPEPGFPQRDIPYDNRFLNTPSRTSVRYTGPQPYNLLTDSTSGGLSSTW